MLVVPLVIASMVVYYLSLDIPKTIINQAIQGVSFPTVDSVKRLLGFDLHRIPYLFALSSCSVGLIVVNGCSSPDQHDEGLDGTSACCGPALQSVRFHPPLPAHALPAREARRDGDHDQGRGRAAWWLHRRGADHAALLGGQALTAMCFILYQHWLLGLIALGIVGVQAFIIRSCASVQLVLGRERQLTRARSPADRGCVEGATRSTRTDTSNFERPRSPRALGGSSASASSSTSGSSWSSS